VLAEENCGDRFAEIFELAAPGMAGDDRLVRQSALEVLEALVRAGFGPARDFVVQHSEGLAELAEARPMMIADAAACTLLEVAALGAIDPEITVRALRLFPFATNVELVKFAVPAILRLAQFRQPALGQRILEAIARFFVALPVTRRRYRVGEESTRALAQWMAEMAGARPLAEVLPGMAHQIAQETALVERLWAALGREGPPRIT
jgi:hypothetical protein